MIFIRKIHFIRYESDIEYILILTDINFNWKRYIFTSLD